VVEEGPSRKYYHLTATGREELQRSRQEWSTFADRLLGLLRGSPGEAGEVAES
jgi:PadR family transcriptional regulator PadR